VSQLVCRHLHTIRGTAAQFIMEKEFLICYDYLIFFYFTFVDARGNVNWTCKCFVHG
jgi:hypothetical protein